MMPVAYNLFGLAKDTEDKDKDMYWIGIIAGFMFFLEVVYHLGCFGFTAANPVFTVALIVMTAALEFLLIGVIRKKKWKKIVFWSFSGIQYLWYAAQFVYMSIFKQPMLLEMIFVSGGDALTTYWREALAGILAALPFLVLMALPLAAIGILMHRRILRFPRFFPFHVLWCTVTACAGLVAAIAFILVGKFLETDYYEEYTEFYDPLSVAESMGVTTLCQRDVTVQVSGLFGGLFDGLTHRGENGELPSGDSQELASSGTGTEGEPEGIEGENLSETSPQETSAGTEASGEMMPTETPEVEEPLDTSPQELPIDWEKLKAEAGSDEESWLADYMSSAEPTKRNEYTGIFEGYNLIFLTAEGFWYGAVREEITPTLYHMTHSGFVFTNYYVPIWQTSTSDGEYINMTGLIPDGQHSMRKGNANDWAFSLPHLFSKMGVGSMAYHNNSLSYYDRHISHNNLGYFFKAATLGNLEESEWGDHLFTLPHNPWPASDLEMMQVTMPEYVYQDRFNIYYMTVSGHMNYNFAGNAMSSKNKAAVENVDMSENGKAYIACHVELDKALEYMLQKLEEAGQLDRTLICLSADHYPYAMEQEQLDELSGKSVADYKDMFRNNLILWTASMEDQPVIVDKVCGAMDLIPTILNLLGIDYDSRMFPGKDIFSEDEGMVIFNDKSFITDTVVYDRKKKEAYWRADLEASGTLTNDIAGYVTERGIEGIYADYEAKGGVRTDILHIPGARVDLTTEEEKDQYISDMRNEVNDRYNLSAYLLRNDYYHDLMEALPEEYHNTGINPAEDWEPAPAEPEVPSSEGTPLEGTSPNGTEPGGSGTPVEGGSPSLNEGGSGGESESGAAEGTLPAVVG